jgi:hypothetical protein
MQAMMARARPAMANGWDEDCSASRRKAKFVSELLLRRWSSELVAPVSQKTKETAPRPRPAEGATLANLGATKGFRPLRD